jgi:hypothetical protein
MKQSLVKYAGLNALGTVLYVAIIATFLANTGNFQPTQRAMALIPVAMLLLFVFSAAITGLLVLGRPVMWYMEGKKKDAVSLFLWTLGFLLVIIIGVFLAILLLSIR